MAPAGLAPLLLESLEAIHRLEEERPPVSVTQLARRLGVGKSVATERLRALRDEGLARAAADGQIRLTDEGRRRALRLVRTHRLLERFLTDRLELPWARVHEEACRLTPVLADDIAEGLARLLGHPASCPHGNPIPGADGTLVAETAIPLHRLGPGRGGIIVRVEREEPELLRYLAALGLFPRTRVEVEEVAPLGGPLLVRVGSSRYALGRKVASRILVSEA